MTDIKMNIDAVDKFYGPIDGGVHAVRNLSMQVATGEIVALLGSSGCGKTSTLRMIAGFEDITRGTIELGGKIINRLPPVRRGVAMAFEGYSLYPPLTIRDNIAFALKSTRLSSADVNAKVDAIAEMLEIGDILDSYPSSISGGQQQRVSLGRALIRDAELYLLDEPMGQLEPQLRALLRGRIKHYIKSKGLTAILVTHDQAEANALADRIAVMEDGRLEQFDSPAAIKDRPANLFSGTFIGEPPMNVFEASIEHSDNTISFVLGVDDTVVLRYRRDALADDIWTTLTARNTVTMGVRPYAVKRQTGGVEAKVAVNQWLGDQSHIAADFAGQSLVMVEHDRSIEKPGDDIAIYLDPASLHFFDADSGAALSHGERLAG